MTTINVEKAQREMSSLLTRLQQGESFVIEQDGKPLGRLEPVPTSKEGKRRFRIGMLDGKAIIPEDIKKPYEAEINETFYGE
jgi:antitoxin (DNA-binding transcriptional repressor) of toxin-antitoxin stability system